MGAPSLQALEEMIAEFLLSCKDKNIKLKPSKFIISTCIEFGGCRISAERLKDKLTRVSYHGAVHLVDWTSTWESVLGHMIILQKFGNKW